MFSKITSHLSSKRLWKVLLLVSGCLLFASSFAEDTERFQGDFIRNLTDIINILNLIVAMLTAPAAVLAGWLLTPDWTFGDFFGLREYLYEIWILVSNIVYIVFAIILLWMAANGIFHPGDTDYVIKKSLPRFLVAILMVPFTWFIVSFTLTIVNKGIAVVMSIPMGTIVAIAGQDEDSSWNRPVIPTKVELNFGEEGGAYGDPDNLKCIISNNSGTVTGAAGKKGEIPCITPAEFIGANPSGPFYMIMVYAYDIFKIQKADLIDTEQLCRQEKDYDKCIRGFTGLLARFFFSFIWAFFFSILLIGLAVVLLYRAFMLWIYIMFSPMFALAVFFKKHNDKFTKSLQVGFKQFFVLAAVPLMVAAILSFGLLFIGIIRDNPGQGGPSIFGTKEGGEASCTSGTWTVKFCFAPDGSDANGDKYDSYLIIGGNGDEDENLNSGRSGATDYSITLEFGPMFSELIGSEAAEMAGGAVGSVQDIFSYAIMNTIALVIIWVATIAAIKNDEVLSTAFAPFENMGSQLGGILKKAPGLIPIPGANGLKLGAVNRGLGGVSGAIDNSISRSSRKITDPINQGLFGTTDNKLTREMRDNMADGMTTNKEIARTLKKNNSDIDLNNKDQRKVVGDSFIAANPQLSDQHKEAIEKADSANELQTALKRALGNGNQEQKDALEALNRNAQAVSESTSRLERAIVGIDNAQVQNGKIFSDGNQVAEIQGVTAGNKLDLTGESDAQSSVARDIREITKSAVQQNNDDVNQKLLQVRDAIDAIADKYQKPEIETKLGARLASISKDYADKDKDERDKLRIADMNALLEGLVEES